LFVLIFQVSKNYRKNRKNNRKRTAITLHQKIYNYRKKSNPLVQIIIESLLACITIIAKCLRCNCHPCYFYFYVALFYAKCISLLSKNEQDNYSKCSVFASSTPGFHFKFCSFCWWGCKNISFSGCRIPRYGNRSSRRDHFDADLFTRPFSKQTHLDANWL